MNNNFEKLLQVYSQKWIEIVGSTTLQEVKERYLTTEDARENALNWVFDNLEEDEQGEYFSKFGQFENKLISEHGDIPIFDSEFSIDESFEQYEAYYQRYGCLTSDFVISWDDTNVLWTDGFTIESIKRPDILMGSVDQTQLYT